MKTLKENKGSSLIFVMIMMGILSIAVLSFLVASVSYATQSEADKYEKQAYLTARSVVDTLCAQIESQSTSASSLLDKMTPPVRDFDETDESYAARVEAAKWDVLDLGPVTFTGAPLDMGSNVTASIKMLSWTSYEITATATSGTVTETVQARITAQHTVTGATSVTTTVLEGNQSVFYVDYGFGTPTTVTAMNLSDDDDTLILDAPFFFSGTMNCSGSIQNLYDIVLWDVTLHNNEDLTSAQNILLDRVDTSVDVLHAGRRIELGDATSVNSTIYANVLHVYGDTVSIGSPATVGGDDPSMVNIVTVDGNLTLAQTIYCNSFTVSSSGSLSLWTGASIYTNTGTITVAGIEYDSWQGVSIGTIDTVTPPTPDVSPRYKPLWANILSPTTIDPSEQMVGGNYYYINGDTLTLSWNSVTGNTEPAYVVVADGQSLTVTGDVWGSTIYYILEGNAKLYLPSAMSTRVFGESPAIESTLNSELQAVMDSAWSNPIGPNGIFNYTTLKSTCQAIVEGYASQMCSVTISDRVSGSMTVPIIYSTTSAVTLQIEPYAQEIILNNTSSALVGGTTTSTYQTVEYFD